MRTGVAVRVDDPRPNVEHRRRLRARCSPQARSIFPDPQRATAGIHFARVLETLGIAAEVAGRLSTHPNGATAMRELAKANDVHPIGVTQITEILNTPGVTLVGPLPREFELATVYTAAVCTRAAAPDVALRLVALLAAERTRSARETAGFEP